MTDTPKITGPSFSKILNELLKIFLKDALRAAVTNPSQAVFFLKTLNWQKRAGGIRENLEKGGIHAPPVIIFSVTSKCNLHCKGCYHQALRQTSQRDISDERLMGAIAEAKELGISFIVFGGGEPLTRPHLLDISAKYPEIRFLMFTNRLLIDDGVIRKMREERNVGLLSLEGYQTSPTSAEEEESTNCCRNRLTCSNKKGISCGTSLTVTRNNFDEVTENEFVEKLVNSG